MTGFVQMMIDPFGKSLLLNILTLVCGRKMRRKATLMTAANSRRNAAETTTVFCAFSEHASVIKI